MSRHYLKPLFNPDSVAVFGASARIDSIGQIVFRNMIESGFRGGLYPINPKYEEIAGRRAYRSISEVDAPVELAVIATPPCSVPAIIEECGRRSVKAAIIMTAGFAETGDEGRALAKALLENARRHGIRLIGPNCLGVMRPQIGLNATFNRGGADLGNLAFVSQSGALCTAILDWAKSNRVGFSSVVSIGSSIDVDFGEIIDYLIADPDTRSILLYIEGIRNARAFLSSIRTAAKIKPVILIKAGRHQAASKAAVTHTAALVGSDDVFDAAVRRAGVIRVKSVSQLFSAAKALAYGFRSAGSRLAIVTNGGGPGVMATDYAVELGLEPARLSERTLAGLNKALPPTWSRRNPVDLVGDAQAERYRAAVTACMEDQNVDGVLVILTPQAMTKPLEAAQAVVAVSRQFGKPLIACWMGGEQVDEARTVFNEARLPNFRTPEPAVEVFACLSAYSRNQRLLMQIPGPGSPHPEPDLPRARAIVAETGRQKRTLLTEMESKNLLSAFHIPVAQTLIAHSPDEAVLFAEQIGFPVAMKISSAAVVHKTDAGGVMLNLADARTVREAYRTLRQRRPRRQAGPSLPETGAEGVAVEPMIVKPNGRELMVGIMRDPVFGPVISFGAGGVLAEVMGDRSIALPPLNSFLVNDLIGGARISRLLGKFRNRPPVDREALENIVLRVSEMVCELPELVEMDINPLIADERGAVAVDARVLIECRAPGRDRYAHMAICPYPSHLVGNWRLQDGSTVTIRPIRPEDAALEQAFVRNLSDNSRYFRFINTVLKLSQAQLAGFTQLDYSRELALVAIAQCQDRDVEWGVARYVINPDGETCEFAIVVADAAQGRGLGRRLMSELMAAARAGGIKVMQGSVLAANVKMLRFAEQLGFDVETDPDDSRLKRVSRRL